MKKVISLSIIIGLFLLVAFLGVSVVVTPAYAGVADEVVVKNTAFYPIPDEEFSTTLYVEEGSSVAALDLTFTYNNDYVTVVSAESAVATVNHEENACTIHLAYANTQNASGRLDLVDLTFKVDKNLAPGAYSDWLVWSGENVDEAYTINTHSAYDALDINVDVDVLFVRQKGDAYNNDNDGKINSLDALHCLRQTVGSVDMSEIDRFYANVYTDDDNNGAVINARDAIKILQYSVKMDVALDDRINVFFYDIDAYGNYYPLVTKSVVMGDSLDSIPALLSHDGYENGEWSVSSTQKVAPDFSAIGESFNVYARYDYTGRTAEGFKTLAKVENALNEGFFQAGKYIVNDFQLPYKSAYGSFNMLTSPEFSNVDIIWNPDSKQLAQGISIRNNYTVSVPSIDYTTWVTFTAIVYIDGIRYGTLDFDREIKGVIDLPSDSALQEIVDNAEYVLRSNAFLENGEQYRLPGYVSLSTGRMQYGVEMVQDVDIKWTVDEENESCFDSKKYGFIFLKEAHEVTLKAEFSIDGKVFKTCRIENVTIPAQSVEKQKQYAEKTIANYIPEVISGEILVPDRVNRFDYLISWMTVGTGSGKVDFGETTTIGGVNYKSISVGSLAGYMEEATIRAYIADLDYDVDFYVELLGNSTIIEKGSLKMPDQNLYDALLPIFGVEDDLIGNTILTEESLADASKIKNSNYTVDLSNKGIADLTGIGFLKSTKRLVLSGNDLSGTQLGVLRFMHNLEQISLSNCNLSDGNISNEVFDKMYCLEGIDLSYNNLTNLSFFDFNVNYKHQMLSLTDLFVQGNPLTDISDLVFEENEVNKSLIPNVKRLDLNRAEGIDSALDITPISYIKELSILRLANCALTDISALESCELLTELDLRNNKIKATNKVDEKGLSPLFYIVSLERLWLDGNEIVSINDLQKMKKLTILSLSNNEISSLAKINKMPQLVYLDVDNNQLNGGINLSSLENLQIVCAENNALTQASFPTSLVQLRLNGNDLKQEDIESIGELTNLTYLSLSDNTIGDLAFLENLTELTHLEMANCSLNQIYVVDEQQLVEEEDGQKVQKTVQVEYDNIARLYGLNKLIVLDLSDNDHLDISGIVDNKGGLNKIKVLYLDNTVVTQADCIGRMGNMLYLSMQNSGVSSLAFANYLENLEYANFSGHRAQRIDYAIFSSKTDLRYLFTDSAIEGTLSGNTIELSDLSDLKYLSMRNVALSGVNDMPVIRNLEYLDISNTGFSDAIGDSEYFIGWDKFRKLTWLDVSGNEGLFTKSNLNELYNMWASFDEELTVWLYPDRSVINFDNAREAQYLYNTFLTDFPQTSEEDRKEIHTFFNGSDIEEYGDYYLQSVLREYNLKWTLTDNNFIVENNVLKVSKWALYADRDLALHTGIDVYDNDHEDAELFVDYVYVAPSPYKVNKYTTEEVLDSFESPKYFNVAIDSLTAGTRNNWTFDGWYTELYGRGDAAIGFAHTAIDANGDVPDLKVYGKWLGVITYDVNGGVYTDESWFDDPVEHKKVFVENDVIEFPEATKVSYQSCLWYRSGDDPDLDEPLYPERTKASGGSLTIKADWVGEPVNIVLFDGETPFVSTSSAYGKRLTVANLSIETQKDGYVFKGLYLDSECENAAPSVIELNDTTLIKVNEIWTLKLYGEWQIQNIVYNNNGGQGSMTDSLSTDAILRKNTFTRSGFDFIGWSKDSDAIVGEYTDEASIGGVIEVGVQTVTLYAVWANQATYTLSGDGTYYTVTGLNSCLDGSLYVVSTYNEKPVRAIDAEAFKDCVTIKSVVVENGISEIGAGAFSGCSALESTSLPFVGTTATVAGEDKLFGAIFDRVDPDDETKYYRAYTQQIDIMEISYSDYLATMPTWEYWLPKSLKKVTITDGASLPKGAFIRCTAITEISLPHTLETIPYDAFWGCSSLTDITIPVGVTSIGAEAFENCSSLKEIVIPNTVTVINNKAFSGCSNLETITLPFAGKDRNTSNDVEKVFGYIFGYTKGAEVTDKAKVNKTNVSYYTSRSEKVDDKTVYYYTPYTYNIPASLKTVIFNGNASMGIDGSSTRSAFRYCTTIENVIFGDDVTEIPSYAFYHCSGLKSVTMGSGMTTIKSYAFEYCSALESVLLNDGLTSIGESAFSATPALRFIVIPDSVTTIGNTVFADGETGWNEDLTILCVSDAVGAGWNSKWNQDMSMLTYKTISTYYGVTVDWTTMQSDAVFAGWKARNTNGNVFDITASTNWANVTLIVTYEE